MANPISRFAFSARNIFSGIPEDLLAISARIAIATVFWNSAQTKISGGSFLDQSWNVFNLNQSTFMLFEYEYSLPLIPANIAAYMATFGEFFLSLAIIAGIATRLSATGLLAMTVVIQIFVYPDAWPTHILWATGLLYLIKYGPGHLSVDRLLFRKSWA